MRLLLDTHILVWALTGPARLLPRMERIVSDKGHEVFFSAASIWEIAIKSALGKPDFDADPDTVVHLARDADFTELVVTSAAASRVAIRPPHHRDPFDRLLPAQAMVAGAKLLTADGALARYGDPVMTLG